MADSLLLGPYETLGDTGPGSDWDPKGDWDYQLLEDSDLGAPVPDTATIAGTLLDGDRVTGDRSGNRQCTLPIAVKAPDRTTLSRKVNALIKMVDGQGGPFPLTWKPDGARPVVITGFRGTFTRERIILREKQLVTVVSLVFPAEPFGRSDTPSAIAAASPQLPLDTYDAAPVGATRDAVNKIEGTASAAVTLTRSNPAPTQYAYDSGAVVSVFASNQNLSGYTSIGFRARWVAPANWVHKPWTGIARLSLTDVHNAVHGENVTVSFMPGATGWQLITVALSPYSTTFPVLDLTQIKQFAVIFNTLEQYATAAPPATVTMNIDDLRAYPPSSTAISTTEGAVVTVPAVPGTARAPVSLTIDHGGAAMTGMLLHRPPVGQDPDAAILAKLTANTVTLAAANSNFGGTYRVWLLIGAQGSGTRSVTVTFTHNQGGVQIGQTVVTLSNYTSTTGKFLECGLVTLPIAGVPPENNADTFTITVAPSTAGGVADTFTDVALCDLRGQTVVLGTLPAGSTVVYVDEPNPARGSIGQIYASLTDRTAASSILGQSNTRVGGGPFSVEPGDNRLLIASPDGVLNVSASFYARWLDERDDAA